MIHFIYLGVSWFLHYCMRPTTSIIIQSPLHGPPPQVPLPFAPPRPKLSPDGLVFGFPCQMPCPVGAYKRYPPAVDSNVTPLPTLSALPVLEIMQPGSKPSPCGPVFGLAGPNPHPPRDLFIPASPTYRHQPTHSLYTPCPMFSMSAYTRYLPLGAAPARFLQPGLQPRQLMYQHPFNHSLYALRPAISMARHTERVCSVSASRGQNPPLAPDFFNLASNHLNLYIHTIL
jgi:hypothetical protein